MNLLPASPIPLAEAQLVQRLLARDELALRIVEERYGKNLLNSVLRLVRNEDLAQDILQAGLLKVWLNIGSYDASRGRLYTWMMRLCANLAIDMLRSPRHHFHANHLPLDVAQAQRATDPTTFNPDDIGVRELTYRLKPRQREIIDLLYFGGCTQAETAEQLGIPLATVKTRARTALRVLAGFVDKTMDMRVA